ncbi:hypothetical protein PUR34_18005 [Streptomyces sp. JV185]|nr:hypothetical protein [Streptomyces sp. JV185]MEE1769991.1 hypothetical protein [Streptomyces sp. JV185]
MQVLGDTQAVDDRRALGPAVEAGSGNLVFDGHTGDVGDPAGRGAHTIRL